MKCKPWIRHFQPRKFQCFSSQFALHGLRALDLTDNWKALFWYFLCFFLSFVLFLFFCSFCSLFATSLGPKPSLFVFFCFFFLGGGGSFFLFFVCFFGGFKRQVWWSEGPPHLALNPPYLLFLFYWGGAVYSFLFFAFNTKTGFPPRKRHFCLFWSLSLCFSWAFSGLPLFQFLFLCLSLSLSISLSLSLVLFFLFFLLVLVLLSFGSFCLSHYFHLFLLLFHERNHIKTFNCNFFFLSIFSFLVSCLVFSFQIPFSYLCCFLLFPDFKLWFLFNMNVFGFKTNDLKHKPFWSRGVLQQNVFFVNPCFAKCEKLSFLRGPFFGQSLVDVQKHYKIGISAHV